MTETNWRRVARLMGIDIPQWRHRTFDFLESEGLLFCVHFGLGNAEAVAVTHWEAKKSKHTVH